MKSKLLSRSTLFVLLLIVGVAFSSRGSIAHAIGAQPAATLQSAQSFAGTWNWMFQGKRFATLTLVSSGSGFDGTVTESRIALNEDGTLKKADASEDKAPKQIEKAEVSGGVLHVTVADGFAFTVSLKDKTHAELLPLGAPPNMKPIALVRAN